MLRRFLLSPVSPLACLAVLGVAAVSCDRSTPTVRHLPATTFGSGLLLGRVTYEGPRPIGRTIQTETCGSHGVSVPDETLLIGDNGGLANAIVWIKNIPPSTGREREAVVLDQTQCRYGPHVVAVQVQQPLRILNSDATFHNVHYNPRLNPSANLAMHHAGDAIVKTFETGEFIRMQCDVHPWMRGWVGVVESPFFAVTKPDGSFEIDRIPAGTYTLGVWHELLGTRETSVTIGVAPVTASIIYKPPT